MIQTRHVWIQAYMSAMPLCLAVRVFRWHSVALCVDSNSEGWVVRTCDSSVPLARVLDSICSRSEFCGVLNFLVCLVFCLPGVAAAVFGGRG